MKKLIFIFLCFISFNAYAVDEWKRGDNSDVIKSTDSPSDIPTLLSAYSTNPLNSLLNNYIEGCYPYYTSTTVITIAPGSIVIKNSGSTIKRFRQNTSTTTINTANSGVGGIDTGSLASSTRYYIYAVADASATTFTAIFSASASAPTGITYYTKIGYFDTDGSSNITSTSISGLQNTGKVVQVVRYETGTYATGTTTINLDDSIPQKTEGDEYMTCTITPQYATSILKIDVDIQATNSTDGGSITAALFQDTTSNALTASAMANLNSGCAWRQHLTHYMVSGTTSATTFKVRAGHSSGGTTYFNGMSGAQLFGGVANSSITITEYR